MDDKTYEVWEIPAVCLKPLMDGRFSLLDECGECTLVGSYKAPDEAGERFMELVMRKVESPPVRDRMKRKYLDLVSKSHAREFQPDYENYEDEDIECAERHALLESARAVKIAKRQKMFFFAEDGEVLLYLVIRRSRGKGECR